MMRVSPCVWDREGLGLGFGGGGWGGGGGCFVCALLVRIVLARLRLAFIQTPAALSAYLRRLFYHQKRCQGPRLRALIPLPRYSAKQHGSSQDWFTAEDAHEISRTAGFDGGSLSVAGSADFRPLLLSPSVPQHLLTASDSPQGITAVIFSARCRVFEMRYRVTKILFLLFCLFSVS